MTDYDIKIKQPKSTNTKILIDQLRHFNDNDCLILLTRDSKDNRIYSEPAFVIRNFIKIGLELYVYSTMSDKFYAKLFLSREHLSLDEEKNLFETKLGYMSYPPNAIEDQSIFKFYSYYTDSDSFEDFLEEKLKAYENDDFGISDINAKIFNLNCCNSRYENVLKDYMEIRNKFISRCFKIRDLFNEILEPNSDEFIKCHHSIMYGME